MIYIKYLLYVLQHKKNVFIECWQSKLYLHAFTHDLSKFLPSEFIPYAKWFYGKHGIKFKGRNIEHESLKRKFNKALENHYKRNKHHWNHWVNNNIPMKIPNKYVIQMICDWKGMSRKFGDSWKDYYLKNKRNMKLNSETEMFLDYLSTKK